MDIDKQNALIKDLQSNVKEILTEGEHTSPASVIKEGLDTKGIDEKFKTIDETIAQINENLKEITENINKMTEKKDTNKISSIKESEDVHIHKKILAKMRKDRAIKESEDIHKKTLANMRKERTIKEGSNLREILKNNKRVHFIKEAEDTKKATEDKADISQLTSDELIDKLADKLIEKIKAVLPDTSNSTPIAEERPKIGGLRGKDKVKDEGETDWEAMDEDKEVADETDEEWDNLTGDFDK